jgi:hypothetical protein
VKAKDYGTEWPIRISRFCHLHGMKTNITSPPPLPSDVLSAYRLFHFSQYPIKEIASIRSESEENIISYLLDALEMEYPFNVDRLQFELGISEEMWVKIQLLLCSENDIELSDADSEIPQLVTQSCPSQTKKEIINDIPLPQEKMKESDSFRTVSSRFKFQRLRVIERMWNEGMDAEMIASKLDLPVRQVSENL